MFKTYLCSKLMFKTYGQHLCLYKTYVQNYVKTYVQNLYSKRLLLALISGG